MAENKDQKNIKNIRDANNKLCNLNPLGALKKAAADAKTYETLSFVCDKIENAITNKNMDKAELWLRRLFARIRKTDIKNAISQTELSKFLNDKSKFLKYTRNINSAAKYAGEAFKYFDVAEKSVEAIASLTRLYYLPDQQLYNVKLSKLEQDRNKLKQGYKNMAALTKCLDVINCFSPPVVKSMIGANIKVFNGAEKVINIAASHAAKIEKAVKKDMGKLQNAVPKIVTRAHIISQGVENIKNLNDF
jgi:hypothetical protein